MFKLICVTNRNMCDDFLTRVREVYENGVSVILREKDLDESAYEDMAKQVLAMCPDVTLHTYVETAKRLEVNKIHLPMRLMNTYMQKDFETVGVSVHSVSEAIMAEKFGASYVTAGHIFSTDCKKGLAPRGTDFLRSAVNAVNIPVYAIGGISPENITLIKETGAAGACIMSGFMRSVSVVEYLKKTTLYI